MKARLLAVVTASLLVAGCSVLLRTEEPRQCTTDRDCDESPALRDRSCTEGFCVVAPPLFGNDGGEGCVSTELCTNGNSGRLSVCSEPGGACTPWQTARCSRISGAWRDPNAIFIGSIYPFTVKQVGGARDPLAYATRVQRAIDLGLEEWNQQSGGGFLAGGVGPRQPFAVLHCDSEFEPGAAKEAMRHLADVVKIRALIVGADEDLAAVNDVAISDKIPVVCSDCIAELPPGGWAWRIAPPLALEAPMAAWRVRDLEAAIRARPAPPATVKVAVLESPELGPKAFVAALLQTLRFNGKTALENGSSFARVTSPDILGQQPDEAVADAVVAAAPDVVVVAMGEEFVHRYMDLIEARWPAGAPRPSYILTNLNRSVAPFQGTLSDELRRRLSGTRPASDPERELNVPGYEQRYRSKWLSPPDGNESGYDAFYAMAYAIAGAGMQQAVFDGALTSASFGRLREGALVDVGPRPIGNAIVALAAPKGAVNLRGLLSELDWDLATHDLVMDAGMYCFQRDAAGLLQVRPDAGPRYAASTGAVVNAYTCE